ncbi:MAG TPA: M56 family metallopeptidase [Candidatus Acidoferrales bacterium]|nr:M56 family metallopeptidase [Candidatus Acidoferrales bacterium]
MSLAYLFRLACLCLAVFFLVQLALGSVTRAMAPWAIQFAARLRPPLAARFLFILRLLPAGAAVSAVCALCLPSYLWFEPQSGAESVGIACAAAAAFGAALWAISLYRVLHASAGSLHCAWRWRRFGRQFLLPENGSEVLVIEENAPLLALSGIFHSRLVASRGVIRALSSEQLSAALLHERAHRVSCDNLKRLLLLLAPDIFPFVRALPSLERAWSRLTEWAADDRAVEGNAHRSLALAEALVRVSRIGASPRPSPFLSTLVPDDADLFARVNRLLQPCRAPENSRRPIQFFVAGTTLALAGLLLTILLQPSTFYTVHRLLEHLVR